ncbi:hypothetical protein D9M71_584140 [compost metagenome]
MRALPQSPREPGRRQCTGPAAARRHAPDHAVRRPLPRRRADPRRGVRVRLLRAEQDVRHGCDLPRLPRAALRPSARRGQCAVRRLPQPAGQSALPQPAEEVLRRSFPPFPPGRQPRRTVRQLSHPDAHLHGGGRPPRPQLPRPASRSGRAQRRAGCLHRLSSGSRCGLGGAGHRGEGRPAAAAVAPWRGVRRRAAPRPAGDRRTGSADRGPHPSGHRAGQRCRARRWLRRASTGQPAAGTG